MRRYHIAIFYVLLSAALNSFGGLFLRSVESASVMQVILLRSAALSAAVAVILLIVYGRRIFSEIASIGAWGFAGALLYCDATIFFMLSMSHTTIANTLFVLSAVPFFTAFLGWVFIREPVSPSTWVAMILAAAGIAVMFGDGWVTGRGLGNALAIAAALSFSGFIVILRAKRTTDMMPTIFLGSLIAALGGAGMSRLDLAVSLPDLMICLVWGGIFSCVALVLLVSGSKSVRGADLTILVMLEYILGPTWVWLVVGELPSSLTLLGGALVLCAVAGRAILSIRPTVSLRDA